MHNEMWHLAHRIGTITNCVNCHTTSCQEGLVICDNLPAPSEFRSVSTEIGFSTNNLDGGGLCEGRVNQVFMNGVQSRTEGARRWRLVSWTNALSSISCLNTLPQSVLCWRWSTCDTDRLRWVPRGVRIFFNCTGSSNFFKGFCRTSPPTHLP